MLKLRELIKKVRTCKTAEEERSVINKESAEIRNMGKEQSDLLKSRNLAKCVFMHMLGYPMGFIQMTCVNLLASNKFTDKRIAYVALCVLMDEKSEVLLLTSHTIKKDLESSNQYIVAAALNALGEICTPDMCRDSAPEVLKLLANNNPYIKKKAALAMGKIIRKCPEQLDTVAEKLNTLFEDKNHGVLICGLSLVTQVFKQDATFVEKYRRYIPNLSRFLKNLSSTSYDPGYDMNGVTDPFLQVKILETLYYFGKNNADAAEEMNDLLASISTNTDSNKNTGNAVLYELVRTIIGIESNSGLKSLASSILGKFLGHKDNNYKYVALNTLQEVAKNDLNSVQKHKNVILECLKDSDISIKRRSLDLVYIIINSSNIKSVMKECLNFLLVAENEFKLELTTKLCQSLEKYSPSIKWEIDTVIKILCLAGNFVNDETISSVINLIISTPELHLYSIHKIFIAMKNNLAQEGLIKVGVYILGEIAQILISSSVIGPDNERITVGEEEILKLIDEINARRYSPHVKEYLLNCYFKLSSKVSEKSAAYLKNLLEGELKSYHCEVQQRATEYIIFSNITDENLKREITKKIPVAKMMKENGSRKAILIDEYDNDGDETNKSLMIRIDKSSFNKNKNNSYTKSSNENPAVISKNKTGNLIDDFSDIFGGGAVGGKNAVKVGNDLGDIFNNMGNIDLTTAPNKNVPNSNSTPLDNTLSKPTQSDLLSSLDAIYSSNMNSQNSNQIGFNLSSFDSSLNLNPMNMMNSMNTNIGGVNQMMFNNNLNYGNINNLPLNPISSSINNLMPMTNLNFTDNSLISNSFGQSLNNTPAMKQIFKNDEITVYVSLNVSADKSQVNGSFYVSNNLNKLLNNIKLNLSVKKHIICKVLSTSGTSLEPLKSLGIKKDVSLTNNEPDKNIVMKISYSYNVDGRDVSNSFMFENI